MASRIRSYNVFAAVRSATPGLPVEESGAPPFSSGPFMFAHNGAIEGFRHTALRPLRDALSDESYAGLLGTTDSETIFAGLLDRLGGRSHGPGRGDRGDDRARHASLRQARRGGHPEPGPHGWAGDGVHPLLYIRPGQLAVLRRGRAGLP
jgi:hypothetical protein